MNPNLLQKSYLLQKHAPWIAFGLSMGLLLGAWIFQYGFGYAPCQMCYWQRHVHKLVIALAIFALIMQYFGQKKFEAALIWLTVGGLLLSALLAFYHVGVEYKWWEGPKTCASGTGTIAMPEIDPNDPLSIFDKKINGPSCSDAVWHFIGLSMAAWNAIISLLGAFIVIIARVKGHSKGR